MPFQKVEPLLFLQLPLIGSLLPAAHQLNYALWVQKVRSEEQDPNVLLEKHD